MIFSRLLSIKGLDVSEKLAGIILKNRGRALDIRANIGTAFASPSSKAALSRMTEVINFDHTGKGLYFGKFVGFMLSKQNKKHQD